MASSTDAGRAAAAPSGMAARMTTGAKLLVILSIALLPLALIAVVATLQTGRLADAEVRARLRVAANESARALAIEMIGDMTALRAAAASLARDPQDAPSCARVQGVFAQQASAGARFAITDASGRLLCGEPLPAPSPAVATGRGIVGSVVPERGLVLAVAEGRGRQARAFFSREFLARLAAPSGQAETFGQSLMTEEDQLELATIPGATPLDRRETVRNDLGLAGLSLRTSIRSAPITSSFVVALLLPLLMWAAAAGIAWLVVDRLLIGPLRRLRASVAAYRPGEVIDTGTRSLPAQEIRELGDTFRAISRTVALHEQGLAEGLVRQTKLTREVHHRVKNNLQVISSLINFHARGAPSSEVAAAYASIQRRVDALAVVHRNHFADAEDTRGLAIRAVLGELASNMRATAPEGGPRLSLILEIDNYLVSQDTAVAMAFLVTETVELSMNLDPAIPVRITLGPTEAPDRAKLCVLSPAFRREEERQDLVQSRYGRIMEGLSRQLRSRLNYDADAGAYEIDVPVLGRD